MTHLLRQLNFEIKEKQSPRTAWTIDCLSIDFSLKKYSCCNANGSLSAFIYDKSKNIAEYKVIRECNETETEIDEEYKDVCLNVPIDYTYSTIFCAKYYAWFRFDKYDERLHLYLTVTIDDKITVEFKHFGDEHKIELSKEWFYSFENNEQQEILESLKKLDFNYHTYTNVPAGEIIYDIIAHLYKFKNTFNL